MKKSEISEQLICILEANALIEIYMRIPRELLLLCFGGEKESSFRLGSFIQDRQGEVLCGYSFFRTDWAHVSFKTIILVNFMKIEAKELGLVQLVPLAANLLHIKGRDIVQLPM